MRDQERKTIKQKQKQKTKKNTKKKAETKSVSLQHIFLYWFFQILSCTILFLHALSDYADA